MITLKDMTIGLLIILISYLIGSALYNPYPCTTSCCGCETVWEALVDSLGSIIIVTGFIVGLFWIVWQHKEVEG